MSTGHRTPAAARALRVLLLAELDDPEDPVALLTKNGGESLDAWEQRLVGRTTADEWQQAAELVRTLAEVAAEHAEQVADYWVEQLVREPATSTATIDHETGRGGCATDPRNRNA